MHFLHLRTFHTVKPSKWSSRTIPCGSTLLKDLFQPTHRTAPHYHHFSNFGFTMDDAKRLGRTTNSLHLVPKVITAHILRSLVFNFNQPVQTRSHCVLHLVFQIIGVMDNAKSNSSNQRPVCSRQESTKGWIVSECCYWMVNSTFMTLLPLHIGLLFTFFMIWSFIHLPYDGWATLWILSLLFIYFRMDDQLHLAKSLFILFTV